MSNSVQPQRWQPTRLTRPWDSPGKNTGVGCRFLLQCMKVKSESEVTQSSDPVDCSLPGSSVHGICQARILEWVAIAFSNFPTLAFPLSSEPIIPLSPSTFPSPNTAEHYFTLSIEFQSLLLSSIRLKVKTGYGASPSPPQGLQLKINICVPSGKIIMEIFGLSAHSLFDFKR